MPLQRLMRRMLEPLASHKEGSHGCCWGRDNSGPSRETGVGTGWKSPSGPHQVDIEIARCKDQFGMNLWMQGLTYASHRGDVRRRCRRPRPRAVKEGAHPV